MQYRGDKLDRYYFKPLSAIPTECSYTVKQFVGNSQRIVLSVFDNFVGFTLKRLTVITGTSGYVL